jgi:hypothetical protein
LYVKNKTKINCQTYYFFIIFYGGGITMSIAELPAKVVESTSSLATEKMKICCELLKISYDKKIAPEEVFKDYSTLFDALNTFDALKEITPTQKTLGFIHRNYKNFYFLIVLFVFFAACILYFMGRTAN